MIEKLLFSGILLFASVMVQAEEVNDTSKVYDLDEIVVVSQPKDGRLLRHQPLSSTVLTQREMQMLGVKDLAQLSQYVPSFSMPQYGSRLTSSMYIRGIGSRINNPAVGIYYDNIPLMSKAAFNHHFYHVDRVDVLRGPQGTLYGMNTEGGLVHIYSKNPMVYQGTDISMGIGTGLTSHAEIAHFHRPSDKFAFSAAGFWNGQRGFFKNQALDEWNDKLQEAGGKMRFVYQPTRRLTLDLTADYQWTSQNAFPYGLYDYDANTVADPSTTLLNGYKRQMVNTGLNISYKTDNWLLSSTTSWQYLRDHMEMDQDYLPADFMHLTQIQKQQALTQELIMRSHGQRFSFSLILDVGRKFKTSFGGTIILCPVDGLTTMRSNRFFTSKVPNDVRLTQSPSSKESAMASTTDLTKLWVTVRLYPVRCANSAMNSLLFIVVTIMI